MTTKNTVFVEYCKNCSNHDWCTKHNEAKYHDFFNQVKQGVEIEFDHLVVYANINQKTGQEIVPKLGAFEVIFQNHTIFSKLKTRTWPTIDTIIGRIKAVMDGRNLNEYINSTKELIKKQSIRKRHNRNISDMKIQRTLKTDTSNFSKNHEEKSFSKEDYMETGYGKNKEIGNFPVIYPTNTKLLTEINKNFKKRGLTPTRLESTGTKLFEGNSSRQYSKLAYLDSNKRVIEITKENEFNYQKERFMHKDRTNFTQTEYNDNSLNMRYNGETYPNSMNPKDKIEGDYESARSKEKYRSESLPISRIPNPSLHTDIDMNLSTIYTEKCIQTEENVQPYPKNGKELKKYIEYTDSQTRGFQIYYPYSSPNKYINDDTYKRNNSFTITPNPVIYYNSFFSIILEKLTVSQKNHSRK